MEFRLSLLLIQKETHIMEPNIDLSSLSIQELLLLEQQILQEQSRRIMSNPNTIVVEAEATAEAHKEAIKKLISDR